MTRPTLFLTVGLPGAGKTTRARDLAATHRILRLTPDDWMAPLFGDSHAHGMDGVQFFTRQKAITTRWLDPSHGGLNLGFPQNG